MTDGFRHIIGYAGTPVQQSMTSDPSNRSDINLFTPVLGVILAVHPSDSDQNSSAIRRDNRHGFMHQCSVFVTDSNFPDTMVLPQVVIPPFACSGLNDYAERLPKGSTMSLSGQPYNTTGQGIHPADLDGERCVVGFIGGRITTPFIMAWWPHPQNGYDPQTTGNAFQGTALNQTGRFLNRINGVETTITSKGDIYLDTNGTNNVITPQANSFQGRYPQARNDAIGGSISVRVKNSQQFELTFNLPGDGQGINGSEDQLPQTNPKPVNGTGQFSSGSTSINANSENINLAAPGTIQVGAKSNLLLSGGSTLELDTTTLSVECEEGVAFYGSKFYSVCNGETYTQASRGLQLVSGITNSTTDPLASTSVLATGNIQLRSGVYIDPASPPATPATPASLVLACTGNSTYTVGNESDSNLPPADLEIKTTGSITTESTVNTTFKSVGMLNLDSPDISIGSSSTLPATNGLLRLSFSVDAGLTGALAAMSTSPTPPNIAAAVNALVAALTTSTTTITKAQ